MEEWKICSQLIKLKKLEAEVQYKIGYLQRISAPKEEISEVEEELTRIREEIKNYKEEIRKKGITFFLPNEKQLEEFNEKLKNFKEEELDKALKTKSGEAWEILSARGEIIKRNLELRDEIGKLIVEANNLPSPLKEKIIGAIKEGRIREEIEFEGKEREKIKKIVKRMNRVGLNAVIDGNKVKEGNVKLKEVAININGNIIWVPEEEVDEIIKNEEELENVGMKIQIKNAEKQIRKFTPEEEKMFGELQKRYLALLKKREEYLKKYAE